MAQLIDQEKALEKVTRDFEMLEFDSYLAQLEERIRRERIAMLSDYLDRGTEVLLDGSGRSVLEKIVRANDRLDVETNAGQYRIIAGSRDTAQKVRDGLFDMGFFGMGLFGNEDTQSIDAFTLPTAREEFKAQTYPLICQLADEVAALRQENRERMLNAKGKGYKPAKRVPLLRILKNAVTDKLSTNEQKIKTVGSILLNRVKGLRDKLQEKYVQYNNFGFETYITEQLVEVGVHGFGGHTELFTRQYRKESKKNFRHALTGAAVTTLIMALLTASMPRGRPQDGMSNPHALSGDSVPGDMKDDDGNMKWSPDGKQLPNPGEEKKGQKGNSDKSDPLKKLQDQYLKPMEGHEPERMRDVRKAYQKLTREIVIEPKTKRHDLVKPEDYFTPRKLEPFPLKDKAVEIKKPTREKPERSVLVILDCTSSMDNPEEIRNGKPATGYFIATQVIKSVMNMGATVRVMKYPVLESTDTAIFDATSMDSALEELLYNSGGAYDAQAVEHAATVYLTVADRKDLPPMDIVFITDAGPTYEGALTFMDLEQKIRDKDRVYWINTQPLESLYPTEERRVKVGTKERNKKDNDRRYFQVKNLTQARRAAERIVKNYER